MALGWLKRCGMDLMTCCALRLKKGIDLHVVLLEAGTDVIEGLVDGVGELQHFKFVFIDGAGVHHGLPVQNLIPIFSAVDKDDVVLSQLARLHEGEHFHELVKRAEPPRENYQGLGDLREPELTHEEVMEIET